jgi:hypothetical protein
MRAKLLGLIAIIALALIGCQPEPTPDNGTLKDLSGDITISPATATIGGVLTANYSGSETVSYQWNKDGSVLDGKTALTLTADTAGSYTVTVSASGYNSKTSEAVVVIADENNKVYGTLPNGVKIYKGDSSITYLQMAAAVQNVITGYNGMADPAWKTELDKILTKVEIISADYYYWDGHNLGLKYDYDADSMQGILEMAGSGGLPLTNGEEQQVATSADLDFGGVKIKLNYKKKPSDDVPAYITRIQSRFDAIVSVGMYDETIIIPLTHRNGNYSINVVYSNDNFFNEFRAVNGQTLEVHASWLTTNGTTITTSQLITGFNAMLALPDPLAVATSADLTLGDIKITLNYKKKPSDDVPPYVTRIQGRLTAIANTANLGAEPYASLVNNLTYRNGNYSINVVYGDTSFDGFRTTDGQTLEAHDTWLTANAENTVINAQMLVNAFNAMLALPAVTNQ